MENKRGITLISLIITIIVLLILAGVAMSAIINEGVIQKASEAKEVTIKENEKEKISMALTTIAMDDALNGEYANNITVEKLQNALSGGNVTVSDNYGIVVRFNESGNEYNIEGNKEITEVARVAPVTDQTPGELAGAGTEQEPYLVESIEDLVTFSDKVSGLRGEEQKGFGGEYVKLNIDLDFKNNNSYVNYERTDYGDVNGDGQVTGLKDELLTGKGFTPIGNGSNYSYYLGNYDGNNKTIHNLYINSSEQYAGLFGYVYNYYYDDEADEAVTFDNTIKNVKLSNLSIKNNSSFSYVGGVIGYVEPSYSSDKTITVDNCSVSNSEIEGVKMGNSYYNTYIAGVIGCIDSSSSSDNTTVTNCSIYNSKIKGTNETDRDSCVSGVIGYVSSNNTIIDNCSTNNSEIENAKIGNGYNSIYTAGVIGFTSSDSNKTVVITNCTNNSKICATSGYIGGIIASCDKVAITECSNYGDMIASRVRYYWWNLW